MKGPRTIIKYMFSKRAAHVRKPHSRPRRINSFWPMPGHIHVTSTELVFDLQYSGIVNQSKATSALPANIQHNTIPKFFTSVCSQFLTNLQQTTFVHWKILLMLFAAEGALILTRYFKLKNHCCYFLWQFTRIYRTSISWFLTRV